MMLVCFDVAFLSQVHAQNWSKLGSMRTSNSEWVQQLGFYIPTVNVLRAPTTPQSLEDFLVRRINCIYYTMQLRRLIATFRTKRRQFVNTGRDSTYHQLNASSVRK